MKNCNACQFSYDDKTDVICPLCGEIFDSSLWDDVPIIIEFLTELSNRSARCIDKLKSKGVLTTDTRRVKLATFNVITLRIIFTLNDYKKDIQFFDSRIPKTLKSQNPNLDDSKLQMIIGIIDVYNEGYLDQ